jgi:Na+-transporting NADH:ubiquinone oxidoreductase subunit C
MDVNKNSYTFIFATIMVVVVAALLSFAATNLKPFQDTNIEQEKMQSILSSIQIDVERSEAAEAYQNYIKEAVVLQDNQLVEGQDAFTIDLAKEIRKPAAERFAPLYIAEKEGQTYYIIPLRGAGLWGPVWGYLSLQEDVNTVYGATFDHKAETPGLGAEISTPIFEDQFKGKHILDTNLTFVGIDVRKGDASTDHQVDGISGGTITSDGVEAMILDNMEAYVPYLKERVGLNTTAALIQY